MARFGEDSMHLRDLISHSRFVRPAIEIVATAGMALFFSYLILQTPR